MFVEKQKYYIEGKLSARWLPFLMHYFLSVSSDLQNKTNIQGIAQLFDVSGRMLFESNMNPNSDEYMTSGLTSGVYLVKMTAGKYKNTVKLIIK